MKIQSWKACFPVARKLSGTLYQAWIARKLMRSRLRSHAANGFIYLAREVPPHIAQVAALNFLGLGFQTIAFVDPIQQHAAAKLATSKDVAIAVTYSGNQADLAETLQTARKRKTFCVAITSFQQSLIAKSAHDLLLMFIPPETLRGQAGAHRVAQIALLDTLAVRAAEIRTSLATNKPRMKVKAKGPRLLVKGAR